MKKTLFAIIWMLCIATTWASAEPDSLKLKRAGAFCYAPYGQSLYSDMHPRFVRWDITWGINHPAYDWSNTGEPFRWTSMGVFGLNLPLWRGEFDKGRFGVSLAWSASAEFWLDLFEPITAPAIDTDYKISVPTITFIHRLNKGFAKNYSLAFTAIKHESTHIGDELQIEVMERGYPLRRVNVSDNWAELAFTLNEPEDRFASCHTFKAGIMILYFQKMGWYVVNPTDGNASLLSKSNSPWEAYLEYQYQTPSSKHGFQGVFSAELRNRLIYGYTYDGNGLQDERRTFTYNLFLGARYNTPNYDGIFSHMVLGVRAYHGNCPYGQFRNLPKFAHVGVCLIVQ